MHYITFASCASSLCALRMFGSKNSALCNLLSLHFGCLPVTKATLSEIEFTKERAIKITCTFGCIGLLQCMRAHVIFRIYMNIIIVATYHTPALISRECAYIVVRSYRGQTVCAGTH